GCEARRHSGQAVAASPSAPARIGAQMRARWRGARSTAATLPVVGARSTPGTLPVAGPPLAPRRAAPAGVDPLSPGPAAGSKINVCPDCGASSISVALSASVVPAGSGRSNRVGAALAGSSGPRSPGALGRPGGGPGTPARGALLSP